MNTTYRSYFAKSGPNVLAYRYALKELNPFALLGADYSKHNQNGELIPPKDPFDRALRSTGKKGQKRNANSSFYAAFTAIGGVAA